MKLRNQLLRLRQALGRRWPGLVLALVAVAGAVVAWPHLRAWQHYRAGQAALERYHAEEALAELEACLRVWPGDGKARLLAARAARQAGRLDEAARHLEVGQKSLGSSEDVLLEWSLQRAAAGDLASVEQYLQSRLRTNFLPDGPLIYEATAAGYLRMYRFLDVYPCLNLWLERQPDNVQALFLRASAWWGRRLLPEAAADYRRVLQLDPQRREARWQLARCLVETLDFGEALPLLDEVLRERPGDPDAGVQLALCREGLGQLGQARAILDGVLREHPDHGLALIERGRLALQAGQAAEAERWLRRGLAVLPDDLRSNSYLAEVLLRQGRKDEAEAQQARVDQLRKWNIRLRRISEHEISNRPYDPSLYCEIGTLEIRLGRPDLAYRWLLLALDRAPNYPPVHAALADFYEKQGDAARAAYHRQLAQ